MAARARSVKTHALQRSIGKLATSVIREQSGRDKRNALHTMGEREEQFQIKCSGRASDYPAWQEADLIFDQTFSAASGRRMSLLTTPQVTCGYEIETAFSEAPPVDAVPGAVIATGVMLSAAVVEWILDDSGNYKGARVAIAATSPGDNVRFTGYVHVTFQGFGALTETADTGD